MWYCTIGTCLHNARPVSVEPPACMHDCSCQCTAPAPAPMQPHTREPAQRIHITSIVLLAGVRNRTRIAAPRQQLAAAGPQLRAPAHALSCLPGDLEQRPSSCWDHYWQQGNKALQCNRRWHPAPGRTWPYARQPATWRPPGLGLLSMPCCSGQRTCSASPHTTQPCRLLQFPTTASTMLPALPTLLDGHRLRPPKQCSQQPAARPAI
jgi:hypothetical protein